MNKQVNKFRRLFTSFFLLLQGFIGFLRLDCLIFMSYSTCDSVFKKTQFSSFRTFHKTLLKAAVVVECRIKAPTASLSLYSVWACIFPLLLLNVITNFQWGHLSKRQHLPRMANNAERSKRRARERESGKMRWKSWTEALIDSLMVFFMIH